MSAETRLWQAVLYQTVDDALHGAAFGGSETTKLRSIEEARSFLTKPSRDLDLVCSSAGFDMTVIVERMRKLIAEAPPVEDLIAGKVARRMAERAAKEREEATVKPRKAPAARYTHDGESLTIAEWAERSGYSESLIRGRLSRCWSIGDAITITPEETRLHARQIVGERIKRSFAGKNWARGSPPRMITHEGETLTLGDWAERLGATKQTIRKRLAKGLTIAG